MITEIEDSDFDLTKLPTETEADQRREDAFNAVYTWGGREFEGLSCSRKDLWVSLCHKAGYPPLSACFDELTLFVPLAKALIFVCLTPAKQLKKLRAEGIQSLVDACEEWVDENVRLNQETDILQLGLRVFNDASENRAEAVPSGSDKGKS
jgi:hypothetical protein